MSDPYPFESADDLEITELQLEDVDAVAEAAITVGQLVSEHESWRFGHVIVDEAQDLTPMQWRMVLRRARGSGLTIVGDLAQRTASAGGTDATDGPSSQPMWSDLLPHDLAGIERRDLTINYRSPERINDIASLILAQLAPDLCSSTSVRPGGGVVETASGVGRLCEHVDRLLSTVGGQIAVIGTTVDLIDHERVSVLRPVDAKGLEFDGVVVVEPADLVDLPNGLSHLYVAVTRATRHLVLLHDRELPAVLTVTRTE